MRYIMLTGPLEAARYAGLYLMPEAKDILGNLAVVSVSSWTYQTHNPWTYVHFGV